MTRARDDSPKWLRRRHRVAWMSAFGLLALVVTGPALADDLPQTDWPNAYRHPMHRVHPPRSFVPPRLQYSHSRAVYRLPDGLKGLATVDHALSRLCQRGAFIQESDGFYWAVTPDRRYGVAFSGGANLNDPQKKAQPGKVYFFHGQDSRCTVYAGDQATLMPHYIGS